MANPMLDQGPVPRIAHGAIEYLAGIALIAMPLILEVEAGAAVALAVALGIVVLLVAATTEDAPGMIDLIPTEIHVVLDFVLSVVLIATPFVFAFSNEVQPTVFFVGLGILHLLLTIGTRFRTRQRDRQATSSA